MRRKAEAAVGLLATTSDGKSAAENLIEHCKKKWEAEPVKKKLLERAIKAAINAAINAKALEEHVEETPLVGDSE